MDNKFKITFSENWFKKKNDIIKKYRIKNIIHKILYYLNCLPSYKMKILDSPKQINGGYEYNVQLYSKTYLLFGIKIKTIIYSDAKDIFKTIKL